MLYKNDLSKTDTFGGNDVTETRIVPAATKFTPVRRTITGASDKTIVLKERTIKGPIGVTCHLCGE